MKRYIRNAESASSKEDLLAEAIDKLQDDFDFAISGIEKLASDGNIDKAIELVSTTSQMINGAVEEMAENISATE